MSLPEIFVPDFGNRTWMCRSQSQILQLFWLLLFPAVRSAAYFRTFEVHNCKTYNRTYPDPHRFPPETPQISVKIPGNPVVSCFRFLPDPENLRSAWMPLLKISPDRSPSLHWSPAISGSSAGLASDPVFDSPSICGHPDKTPAPASTILSLLTPRQSESDRYARHSELFSLLPASGRSPVWEDSWKIGHFCDKSHLSYALLQYHSSNSNSARPCPVW